MHILAAHLAEQIGIYGTIGMFCEDSLESIHAIVNSVARIYASAPAKERTGLVFQSLHARKQGKQKANVQARLEKLKKKLSGTGQRKRQGKNVSKLQQIQTNEPKYIQQLKDNLSQSLYNDLFITRIDESTEEIVKLSLDDVDSKERDDHFKNLDMELMPCPHCLVLRQDKEVPKCLMSLHIYISHSSFNDKNSACDE